MDAYEASRLYLSGQMSLADYDAIVREYVEQSNEATTMLWADMARQERHSAWRQGFWAGVWLSVVVWVTLLAVMSIVSTHISVGR